jgi:sugar phosphate isomerase/epimerase
MERLSIEPLSVMGLPPVDFVNLAADLGLQHVTLFLESMPNNPYGYPEWSLRQDAGLRKDMKQALRSRGVTPALADGFVIRPDTDIHASAADFDIVAELGAPQVNTVSFDPDMPRTIDQFGTVAELAARAGMQTTMELCPIMPVRDLATALDVVGQVGRTDFRLLIDTMHVFRSGATVAEVAGLDPGLIGYIQLADVPWQPTIPDYMEEACFERMIPGTGELPLLDVLAALPRDVVIGLEVPLRSAADAGMGPHERLGRCVEAARSLLAKIDD